MGGDTSAPTDRSWLRFPPVDGSTPGLVTATIFGGCEVDVGSGDVAAASLRVGSGGVIWNSRRLRTIEIFFGPG
jgi:hypothetical protein